MKMGMTERKILLSWLDINANTHGTKAAIVQGDSTINYSELHQRVRQLAKGLNSLGVRANDRVVILLKNCPEFILSFFATTTLGAIAVPLNVQYKEQELLDYFKDCQPKAVIAVGSILEIVQNIVFTTRNSECEIIDVAGARQGCTSFTEIMARGTEFNGSAHVSPEDIALCQYSSGSTGRPKRILRTHSNLIAEAENFVATVSLNRSDKILGVVPLFHAHGLGNCLLAANHSGATLVMLEGFERRTVLRTIEKEQITVFPGVPFMFSILADTVIKDDVNLSSLRLCFSAGAPLPGDIFGQFYERYGVFIRQLYGSTETGSVSINLCEDVGPTKESVGAPLRNVDVRIVGEDGERLKEGEVGLVGISSPAMIQSYEGSEELNKESFRNGYFFPGDLGRKDVAGNIYIAGRKTLFMNVGGNKVDPEEVEKLLATHPKVKESVVVGVKNHHGDDTIKAVIVPAGPCEETEIVRFCESKIASFKIPRVVEFRDEIPKSPLGKILRKYLTL